MQTMTVATPLGQKVHFTDSTANGENPPFEMWLAADGENWLLSEDSSGLIVDYHPDVFMMITTLIKRYLVWLARPDEVEELQFKLAEAEARAADLAEELNALKAKGLLP